MATFDYRAVDAHGRPARGQVQANDRPQALAGVRRLGVVPIELVESTARSRPAGGLNGGKARAAVAKAIDELGVLLLAGLPLDRGLALVIENIEHQGVAQQFLQILGGVREGRPLSQAMAERDTLFPSSAQAITEAGEANGRLGEALARVARMFAQAEQMRRMIVGAIIYPASLMILAVGVILIMLLYVVPQFESLFATAPADKLPASSKALMAASRGLRDHGLVIAAILAGTVFAVRQLLRQPGVGGVRDRFVLRLPQIGALVRYIETARLARTLGGLIEGGVPLPTALAMACRSIGNRVIATAVTGVAVRVKEGGGLTAPLAATGALPRIAIGFFRTGEETSQLGMMLERLADVLDRDVALRLERLVAVLTPIITICLGGGVAAIIASIMTAILGFNDLAVGQ